MQSKTVHFRQFTYSVCKEESGIMRFRRKRGVKWCFFGDSAVFMKIQLCTRIDHLTCKKIFILNLGLVYDDAKKCEKRYKISCMYTFKLISIR
jgi:hypothetical protein